MVHQEKLYMLGLSLEITTLILSQIVWGVLSLDVQVVPAGVKGWAYIECAMSLHCPVMGFNYRVKDGYYYNEKRSPITVI